MDRVKLFVYKYFISDWCYEKNLENTGITKEDLLQEMRREIKGQ